MEVEMFPCANTERSLADRLAIREAGRCGLAFTDDAGCMTPDDREQAASTLDGMAEKYDDEVEGLYTRAATKLRLGEEAALQCVRNITLTICPFQCPRPRGAQKRDVRRFFGTLDS